MALARLRQMRFHSGMNFSGKLVRSVVLLATAAPLLTLPMNAAPAKDSYLFYVGTYTNDDGKSTNSKGIYAYRFDTGTGQVTSLGLAAETTNPSFVAPHPSGRYLYAVNEIGNYKGPNSGGVSAFSIDQTTGKLTFLNEVPSRGADPCYITVDHTGKYVLVANYTGGSVAAFPILADGKLGEASAFVQHTGHGADPKRQEGPHAHSIDRSPDNRFAFVDDLGLDELLTYKFDSAKGSLTPNDPPFAKLDAASGPRHFALAPNGKFAYVVSEIKGTVTAFSHDAKAGTFQPMQTLTTLPKDFKGNIEDAEIEVHPSGKFLYASNRGDDNAIAIYGIDADKGTLTPVGHVSTGGKTPRNFVIDPSGKFLLAENAQSDNIVIFRIDQTTGKLTPTGEKVDVPSPVCIRFLVAK
jgi:6-phosphogluconolactonase